MYVDLFQLYKDSCVHFLGFKWFLKICRWILFKHLIGNSFYIFSAMITNKWKKRILFSKRRRRREMAFWHEGCWAALYANFSRFLFVEREREMTRPLLFPKEKYLHTKKGKEYTKNGGGKCMTSLLTLFCFLPCYFVFRHLYKTSATYRKKKKIYTRRAAAMDVFPSTSFVAQSEKAPTGGNRDRAAFLLKEMALNIYKFSILWLTTLAPANCPVLSIKEFK